MLRLLLVLCAGLYLTLQLGGQDRGQLRFGLMEAEAEAALMAQQQALAPAAPVDEPVSRAEVTPAPQPEAQPLLVPVAFSPDRPLIAKPAPRPVRVASEGTAPDPAPEALTDVRYVGGRAVNVRSGPSTADEVVGKLARGEAVTVVWVEDNGWARVRVEGDGIEGFMSMDFLTDIAP